jgi:two-component system, NtrC family, response regulator PilR
VVSTPRVLVVDDEPAIRALVAKIIDRVGLSVDTAANGQEAMEKLDLHSYAVLVVDLMMPQVDGYAVIDHLRDHGTRKPAIIVITAGDSAAIRRLDGTKVHSVIRKPFDIEVLSDLVTAAAKSVEERRLAEGDAAGEVLPFRSR